MQKKFVLDLKKSLHENAGSSSAKREEIFYKASRINSNIGSATVYRMVSVLEEIGAISRKNMLRVACSEDCSMEDVCTVVQYDLSFVSQRMEPGGTDRAQGTRLPGKKESGCDHGKTLRMRTGGL